MHTRRGRPLPARLPRGAAPTIPDVALLRDVGTANAVTLVHLIYRKEDYESESKDYEFSRRSMAEHWAAGLRRT